MSGVRKVVINTCFGGFGLSEAAMHAYAARKGITLYPEKSEFGLTTYWTLPRGERPKTLTTKEWMRASQGEREASNKAHSESTIYERDIPRDDPDLVAVVDELGDKANGRCAALLVVEIPGDVNWEIDEYDGNEYVAEVHRTWR